MTDNVALMTESRFLDYLYLPGEEDNPIMESTLHMAWSRMLQAALANTLAGTGHLATGNIRLAPDDTGSILAPDVTIYPGAAGREFRSYTPGPDGPAPLACIEILSRSNSKADIDRRCRRMAEIGVQEIYVLDPERETVVRVEVIDGELHQTSAIGVRSEILQLTFARAEGKLVLCCPGGRAVRPGDDPFGWLLDEMGRADRLLDQIAERDEALAEKDEALAERDREIAGLRAELERARGQGG